VLWDAGHRQQGRALVLRAREELAAAGPGLSAPLENADAWLREHAAP
jgi:hypothetical protein